MLVFNLIKADLLKYLKYKHAFFFFFLFFPPLPPPFVLWFNNLTFDSLGWNMQPFTRARREREREGESSKNLRMRRRDWLCPSIRDTLPGRQLPPPSPASRGHFSSPLTPPFPHPAPVGRGRQAGSEPG